ASPKTDGAISRQASQLMQVESTKKSPAMFSGTRFRILAMNASFHLFYAWTLTPFRTRRIFFHSGKEVNMSTLPPTQTQPRTSDQRVWLRYPSRRAVSCRLSEKNEDAFWPAQACDVSRGGIKLLSIEKLQRGSLLTIRLRDPESTVQAQVRY